jgi:hypothetical protein
MAYFSDVCYSQRHAEAEGQFLCGRVAVWTCRRSLVLSVPYLTSALVARSRLGPKFPVLSMYSDPPSRIDGRVLEPAHQSIQDLQIEADAITIKAGGLDGHAPDAESAQKPPRRRKPAHRSSRKLPWKGPPAFRPLAGSRASRELAARRPPRTATGGCGGRHSDKSEQCHCLTHACTGIKWAS